LRVPLLLAFFILILDILSKAIVIQTIPYHPYHSSFYPYGGVGVFENFLGVEFSIIHLANTGAAWGMFPGWQMTLLVLRLLIIGAMVFYLFFGKNSLYQTTLPMTMILAGALGNVLDTLIHGHVVDMFHFVLWGYDFPAFNIADSAICLGVAWLFMTSFVAPSKEKPNCERN